MKERKLITMAHLHIDSLDGLAVVFLVAGIFLIIANFNQNLNNLGWVLMIIGIVKQLIEWK